MGLGKALGGLLGGLTNSITTGIVAGQNRDFQSQQAQLNRDFANQQLEKQMDFQAQQQLKNQQFAHYMYSNSAQMRMKDLQAAGINPILATGSNAFAAGGSSGSMNNFQKKNDKTTPGNQPSGGQQKQRITAKNVFVFK